jgi:hypothetical protein
MTINSNLFNPIPLFDSKSEWYKNKQTYKGKSSPTIAPCNYILPMQLTINKAMYEALTSTDSNIKILFRLISHDDKKTYSLNKTEVLRNIDLLPTEIQSDDMYASVYMGGRWIVSHDIPIGTYYLMMSYGNMNDIADSKEWYSDLFTFRADTNDLIHIRYRNSEPIIVGDNYMPFTEDGSKVYMDVWIDAEVMNNEFAFEDTTTMQDGYERVEKRISYKKYVAVFPATEYMVEALRLLWHCDSIAMRQRNKRYNIHDVNMEVVWEQDNHFAKVTMKFKTDSIIQTNANAMYMDSARYADFDDDYNIDFDV